MTAEWMSPRPLPRLRCSGIGESGLIHHSKMGSADLRVNDHVEVEVIKVEEKPNKTDIGLRLLHKLDGRMAPALPPPPPR